jgi:hypothetical protein
LHFAINVCPLLSVVDGQILVFQDIALHLIHLIGELAQQGLLFKKLDSQRVVRFEGLGRVVDVHADNPHDEGEGKGGVGLISHELRINGSGYCLVGYLIELETGHFLHHSILYLPKIELCLLFDIDQPSIVATNLLKSIIFKKGLDAISGDPNLRMNFNFEKSALDDPRFDWGK